MRDFWKQTEQQFWSRMAKQPNGCWLWTGYIDPGTGYAKTGYHGKTYRVHRLAFLLTHGYLPKDVCHTCDNITCGNPEHLFAGDETANMQDAAAKDRIAYGRRIGTAVLTEYMVNFIREVCIPGDRNNGYSALARMLGVHHDTVRQAYLGETWRRVSGDSVGSPLE